MNDNKKNLPSHRIFVVRNYERNGEEKASWTEIGVAFANKLGFSIQLQATPIDGRCVALPFEERPFDKNEKNETNGTGEKNGDGIGDGVGDAGDGGDAPRSSGPMKTRSKLPTKPHA